MKQQTIKLNKQDIQGVRKWRHNVPFMEAFAIFLVIFLFSGLMLDSGYHYARQVILGKRGTTIVTEDGWDHVKYHGDMLVTKKQFPHYSTPTFRYEYKTDVPLEAFIDVLDHPQQSIEWFAWVVDHKYNVNRKDLDSLDLLEKTVDFRMVLRPYLSNPLRLHHDREFHLQTKAHIETREEEPGKDVTTATITYKNIEDRNQSCNNCIMAKMDMILTLTSEDEGASTYVSMALNLDMASEHLPEFMTNDMSMRWGALSLHKLVKRCSDNIGLKHKSWFSAKHSLLNVFPVK